MIFEPIAQSALSDAFLQRYRFACSFLQQNDFSALAPGRYEVNDFLYYLIQRYTAKPRAEAAFEAHRRYADIQYLVSGTEAIGFCPVADLTPLTPFDTEKDFGKYADPAQYSEVILRGGEFGLFLPRDAHKPSYHPDGQPAAEVFKVVAKIRVDDCE